MKFRFSLATYSLLFLLAVTVRAQTVIAGWTFPTAPTGSTGATKDFGAANLGSLTAGSDMSGIKGFVSSNWGSTTGNGGGYAAFADQWKQDDYFQFRLSTVGFSQISVSLDYKLVAGTAPQLNLLYSTDGTNFNTLSGVLTPAASFQSANFNLSAITALANDPQVTFRLEQTNSVGKSGGASITVAVDNFEVSGISAVPEPATYALLAGAAAFSLALWRRRPSLANSSRAD